MSISVVTVPVGPLETNAYIAVSAGEALLVDPGADAPRIVQALRRSGAGKVAAIVLTHGHFDHTAAAAELAKATGAPVLLHAADVAICRNGPQQARFFGLPAFTPPEPTRLLAGGETVSFGRAVMTVLHTPGHTPGGICLHGEGSLLCGDTLFAGSVGRTDLPGGSSRDLMDSIQRRLVGLPEQTQVYPGHGPSTSIGREKRSNPFLSIRR